MGVVVIGGGGGGGTGGQKLEAKTVEGQAQVMAVDGEFVGYFASLADAEAYASMLNAATDPRA